MINESIRTQRKLRKHKFQNDIVPRRIHMDNRRNLKIFVFLSTIILILYGVAGSFSVDAEESEDVVALENSDDFVIESEKVDGKMDLEEALGGNIDIEEGEIHGLKITKKLNI